MRWQGHNINRMLLLRNGVCNRRWHEIWTSSSTHRRTGQIRQRQADSQQRLTSAFWVLVVCGARRARMAQTAIDAIPAAAVPASAPPPVPRLGTGYSWRKPFLRRPASPPVVPAGVSAKK